MAKSETKFELKGKVIESLRGAMFRVKLDDNDMVVLCSLSGKLRMNNIRIVDGDEVDVELDVADLQRGRIVWRHSTTYKA